MPSMSPPKVIVVGAGPAGLLLSLLLAKQGIAVEILEATERLDEQPRATHYSSPAVAELRRAGVLEDIIAEGFLPEGVSWRTLDGTFLAGIDASALPSDYPDKMVCLPLNKLGEILGKHLSKQPTAKISFGHKVVKLHQTDDRASVEVQTNSGIISLEADFIVGCDGANSQIRRSLFGDWEFPGKTWDKQIVATNVYYDVKKYGWSDSNFIIDPDHWFMAARISNDGLWRVTYGESPGLTREEYLERLPEKFKIILPGHPEPSDYRLANFSPYKVHQRCAEKFRVGRFLLAADAAHLCNPFGGLGLTSGIVDVGGLSDCLIGIFCGKTTLEILDRYDTVRRQKYNEFVNPISSQNFERLWGQNPSKALENDKFLQICVSAASNKELSLELQLAANALKYDFTQHYV